MKQQPDAPQPAQKVPGRPFPKGTSGNPSGRPRAVATQVLRETITEEDIRRAWEVVISRAHAGDLQAWSLILDRLEGKPTQRQELSGTDGGPLEITQIRVHGPEPAQDPAPDGA